MQELPRGLAGLIGQVRRRWVGLAAIGAFTRAAGASALVGLAALLAHAIVRPDGLAGVLLALGVVVTGAGIFGRAFWPIRRRPGHQRVARFIEERVPELEDTLATAVHFGTAAGRGTPLLDEVLRDADRRLRDFDPDRVISPTEIRRGLAAATLAACALLAVLFVSRTPARQAYEAASVYALPWRVSIAVSPGDVRVLAGDPLVVSVRLSGAGSVLTPVLRLDGSGGELPMARDGGEDRFSVKLDAVREPFSYRVEAGQLASSSYRVTVMHLPRVQQIDLAYEYPPALGLPSRTEEDSGDIYAPLGTRVRLRVKADKAVSRGEMRLASGARVTLEPVSDDVLEGELRVTEDGSYRVALHDTDGLDSPGETEYFVRMLDDRPPDVRIMHPAADRQATQLEEVAIEARADDDHGIARLDLVYSVRGGPEKVLPFRTIPEGAAMTGSRTLYLEDLQVQPGDFVTYYARAADVARGRRSTESRSDIFFIEIKPYDEEFVATDGQGMAGGGGGSLEELVAAQKEIIVATWKLDRRAAGRSSEDILAVARAQAELRERAGSLVRRRGRQGADTRQPSGTGQGTAGNPMELAVQAMGHAQAALEDLRTAAAVPHEMEALDQLLKVQSDNRRRQVSRQANGSSGGGGGNRSNEDLSALFDRELRRQQQTNYETPPAAASREQEKDEASSLDRIRELARRQDELNRRQQEIAKRRAELSPDELQRRLERLTREQSDLRQQAEELSQDMARRAENGSTPQGQQASSSPGGGSQMRDVSEEMRGATSDLRRQDPAQASARGARALDKLRSLERELQANSPDDRRRAVGELQLEAQQLAESQRKIAAEAQRPERAGSADAMRRMAGEKERLADRVEQLERAVRQLEEASGSGQERRAIAEAREEIESEQIERRLRESADALRRDAGTQADAAGAGERAERPAPATEEKAGGEPRGTADQQGAGEPRGGAERRATAEQQLTRAMERVADKLGDAAGERDGESRRLSEQLARTRELREQIADLGARLEKARQAAADDPASTREAGAPPQGERQEGDRPGQDAAGLAELQQQLARELDRAEQLLAQGQPANGSQGGRGETPEAWQPSPSAPGTEGFKQDFAEWDVLRRDVTLALERLEASLSSRLQEKETRDRLSAGADESAPEAYRKLVEQYFRSLASTKKN